MQQPLQRAESMRDELAFIVKRADELDVDIGRIEIHDRFAYVAVASGIADAALRARPWVQLQTATTVQGAIRELHEGRQGTPALILLDIFHLRWVVHQDWHNLFGVDRADQN